MRIFGLETKRLGFVTLTEVSSGKYKRWSTNVESCSGVFGGWVDCDDKDNEEIVSLLKKEKEQ